MRSMARLPAMTAIARPAAIQISLTESPEDVSIVINDNGRGLPVQGRERLTEPYVTTRGERHRPGLAIVKKIMEDHGGLLLSATARAAVPSIRMIFRKQVDAAAEPEPERAGSERPPMAADILIVDDEADIRHADRRHAGRRGLRHARGRQQRRGPGRRSASVSPVWSSWISGCRAATLDGLQMLEVIKRDYPALPVVMISGHGSIETTVRGHAAGRRRFHREAVQVRTSAGPHRARRLEDARLRRESRGAAQQAGQPMAICLGSRSVDQCRAPADRARRADQQPRADHRSGRRRQGGRRAAASPALASAPTALSSS